MMMQSTLTTLLLFIATGGFQVANAQIDNPNFRICGLNYTDVTQNCRSNPTCPTGDNCPAGYTCYQLNERLCPPETPAPTPEPTDAPTPTPPPTPTPLFKVCASGFIEATELCYDTSKTCATCNNITEACFQIRPELCVDPKTATTSPVTAAPTEASTESVAPTKAPVTDAPTKAPTPNRFFCAESWTTVDENCSTLTPCPNGQQDCAGVGNCYQIQAAQCGSSTLPADLSSGGTIINAQTAPPTTASPTESPSAAPQTAQPTSATPTVSPTEAPKPTLSPSSLAPTKAPIPNRFFCASSWATVDENCATATPCPNGQWDCNGLGEEMNCYQIQAAQCPGLIGQDDTGSSETEGEGSGAQLSTPSGSSSQTTVSGPVRVCAKDIIEATFNCNTNTPCPNGAAASCASGEACFELDSCGTSTSNSMTGEVQESSAQGEGEESEFTFGTGVPVPSPGGENQVTSPPTPRPSQAAFEFNWTTPSPNGSNIQQISFVFKLFLVSASVVGAAWAM